MTPRDLLRAALTHPESDQVPVDYGSTAALVTASWWKHPQDIREIEEWHIATAVRKDYIHAILEKQCAIGLKNLVALIQRLGARVQAVFLPDFIEAAFDILNPVPRSAAGMGARP
jgi:hypothetical protein